MGCRKRLSLCSYQSIVPAVIDQQRHPASCIRSCCKVYLRRNPRAAAVLLWPGLWRCGRPHHGVASDAREAGGAPRPACGRRSAVRTRREAARAGSPGVWTHLHQHGHPAIVHDRHRPHESSNVHCAMCPAEFAHHRADSGVNSQLAKGRGRGTKVDSQPRPSRSGQVSRCAARVLTKSCGTCAAAMHEAQG